MSSFASSTVDLQPLMASGKPLSASVAAWLLELFDKKCLWDEGLRDSFLAGVNAACEQSAAVKECAPTMNRVDPRSEQINAVPKKDVIKIFTDYDFAREVNLLDERVVFTDSKENADFIFTPYQIKNFLALPLHQRVGQFPYEGALVRKDLLPLTVRKYCYKNGVAPEWWHPYFDLRTEFHLFAAEHRRRASQGLPNRWIIKPAQGTRALGHRVITDPGAAGLHRSAAVTPLLPDDVLRAMVGAKSDNHLAAIIGGVDEVVPFDGSDRIAQLFVEDPLLTANRKFDFRYFVFVRNFYPLEAYAHQIRYGRLANKEYKIDELKDWQVALTVCAYDDDEVIANKQERAYYSDMERLMEEQYGKDRIDVEGMHQKTLTMLSELFTGAGKEIGSWPNSSAYYAVDLIYEGPASGFEGKFLPQPKVLEVNFMGDWHGVEAATVGDRQLYDQWATDLFLTLSHPDSAQLPHSRLFKL